MSDADAASDDEMMELLRRTIDEMDPVPDSVVSFAKESHRLISFEDELAEIVSDSLLAEGAGTRSTGGLRAIEFQAGDLSVRLEVDGEVAGSVDPPGEYEVSLVTPSDQSPVEVNDRGFFRFERPAGPFRLRVVSSDARLQTDWIRLDY